MPTGCAKGFITLRARPGAVDLVAKPKLTRRTARRPVAVPALPYGAIVTAVFLLVGCGKGKKSEPMPSAIPTNSASSAASTSSNGSPSAASSTGSAGSAGLAGSAPTANDYVPNEFKTGMSRWKDTGVYLDGKPIGFIQFGELPISLKPTWVRDKVSVEKPPGCPIETCPGWKWSHQRTYKFTDYLKAIGVDIHTIKMMHVYGPKLSETIAVTGRDLESKAASEFTFRFGALVAGKAIPHVPAHFGNHRSPDKMAAVMIYVTKKPPKITRDGIELDGVDQTGVPYYGEPLRGGVRVYLDDHLATVIKRQELDVKKATKAADGELYWNVSTFLTDNGIDTSKVVEGWVIRNDRRAEMIAWPELAKMSFSAGSQAHGGVLLGEKAVLANAIALHSRHIQPSELPVIEPDEE